MFVMRPVRSDDLDQLLELAAARTFGLTTLPHDRDVLDHRIRESERAFEKVDDRSRGESFLLVMEESETKQVVGTSGMVSKVGGFEPFYAYRIETSIHHSDSLNVHREVSALHLVAEHNGPCEIGSLFLLPECRGEGRGRLLSLARFLFMAEYRQLFDPLVIAEMRGVIDEQGHSPFWDGLGSHFFQIDFPRADYLSAVDKRFIAELMPRHPIYVPLLPAKTQSVIGQVHERTRPALRLLENEGFALSGMVDIFEAGPVVSSPLNEIRAVRESRRSKVSQIVDASVDAPMYVVANVQDEFRATATRLGFQVEDTVHLDRPTAEALAVTIGDYIRYVSIRPSESSPESFAEPKRKSGDQEIS